MREKRNTAYIALRLPQDEADAIKKAAAEAGEPVSMWMRLAARAVMNMNKREKDND